MIFSIFKKESLYPTVQVKDPRRGPAIWNRIEAAELIVPKFKVCLEIDLIEL